VVGQHQRQGISPQDCEKTAGKVIVIPYPQIGKYNDNSPQGT